MPVTPAIGSSVLNVEQPTASDCTDYTEDELVEFRGVMTDLLSACTALSARYAPHGEWSAAGPREELDEAADLIAELSRTLNKTRRGIRKVNTKVQKRARDTAALG